MASSRWLRSTVLAIALACMPACLAPTLPVPPPTAAAEYLSSTNEAVVTGHADPGAYVSVLNERTNTGIIVRADPTTGAFSVTITAVPTDELQVWQDVGTNRSASLFLCVACTAPIPDH